VEAQSHRSIVVAPCAKRVRRVGAGSSGPAGPAFRDRALKPPQWTNRVYAAPSSNLSRSYSAGESKKLIRPALKTSEVRRPKALTNEKSIQPSPPVPEQSRGSAKSVGSPRAKKRPICAKIMALRTDSRWDDERKVSPNERLLARKLNTRPETRGGRPGCCRTQPLRATRGGTP
jgi:hypothetical protein